MHEYLFRQEAIEKIMSLKSKFRAKNAWDSGYDTAIAQAVEYIKRVPIADARSAKYGKWEHLVCRQSGAHYEVAASCSCCNEYTVTLCGCKAMPFEFCPHCSADMRGEING